MTAAVEDAHAVYTDDGVRLHALVSSPAAPRGVFILCHGLTTNCDEHGQFPFLRNVALRSRFAVVRFDFRGHGASGGTNEDLRLARYRIDADAISRLVDERFGPGIPSIPVGVSFGGAAAIHLAHTRPSCAGLVLWYAVVDYEWHYGPDSSVPFTHLMRAARADDDPAWAGLPVPGTSYYLPSALLEELPHDPTYATLRSLGKPLLAYYGSRDQLVDTTPVRQLAAAGDVDLRIAHGAGHGFILWRPWVVWRTVAWARRRVSQRGPAS